MLKDKIVSQMREAMRNKNQVELEALRMVVAQIKNQEIEKRGELKDEEVVQVLRQQVKRRRESIEMFKKGEREDLVKREKRQLEVIEQFLPQMMSGEEVGKLVDRLISESGEKDFGKIMGQAMEKVGGRADGRLVAEVVKNCLEQRVGGRE
jgi:uncharacterized protein YqeY